MICPACSHELPGGATYCPFCRERGLPGAGPPSPVVQPVLAVRAIKPGISADNDPRERFFLIIACLFSAGVLAVPRLHRSKAFGPVGKAVLGTIATAQTALAVVIIVTIPRWFPWLIDKIQVWLEPHLTRRY